MVGFPSTTPARQKVLESLTVFDYLLITVCKWMKWLLSALKVFMHFSPTPFVIGELFEGFSRWRSVTVAKSAAFAVDIRLACRQLSASLSTSPTTAVCSECSDNGTTATRYTSARSEACDFAPVPGTTSEFLKPLARLIRTSRIGRHYVQLCSTVDPKGREKLYRWLRNSAPWSIPL